MYLFNIGLDLYPFFVLASIGSYSAINYSLNGAVMFFHLCRGFLGSGAFMSSDIFN